MTTTTATKTATETVKAELLRAGLTLDSSVRRAIELTVSANDVAGAPIAITLHETAETRRNATGGRSRTLHLVAHDSKGSARILSFPSTGQVATVFGSALSLDKNVAPAMFTNPSQVKFLYDAYMGEKVAYKLIIEPAEKDGETVISAKRYAYLNPVKIDLSSDVPEQYVDAVERANAVWAGKSRQIAGANWVSWSVGA